MSKTTTTMCNKVKTFKNPGATKRRPFGPPEVDFPTKWNRSMLLAIWHYWSGCNFHISVYSTKYSIYICPNHFHISVYSDYRGLIMLPVNRTLPSAPYYTYVQGGNPVTYRSYGYVYPLECMAFYRRVIYFSKII